MNGQYNIGDVVFNNWTLARHIGEGSYGHVFEAGREDFERTYKAAIKIVTIPKSPGEIQSVMADGMDDDGVTAYFRKLVEKLVDEFSLMAKLKGNSNIVSYEDHTVIKHTNSIGWDIIIRMELLTPLLTHIQSKTLSKKDVVKLGMDMCRALELCQKHNIVHRDIKPENIFISESGDFKLGDFGIARTVEKTSSGMTKIGTYTYMAPEISRGEAYGSSVDIYSLGIVLYRMLNENRTPFLPDYPTPITHEDKENALAKRISGAPMPFPKNADGRLAEIVLKACAYDTKGRYSSPMQMREELEAIIYKPEEGKYIYPQGDHGSIKSNVHVKPPPPHQTYDNASCVSGDPTHYNSTNSNFEKAGERTENVNYQARREHPQYAQQQFMQNQYANIPIKKAEKRKILLPAILVPVAVIIAAVVLVIALAGNNGTSQTGSHANDLSVDETLSHSDAPIDETLPGERTSIDESPPNTDISADPGILQEDEESVQMPELVNTHFSEARNVLNGLKLDLIIIEEPVASDAEKGYLIKTIPEAGTSLSRGNSVTIIYSSGPIIRAEVVPDLVGSTIARVESAFETLNITPVFIYFEDESPEGTVLYIEKNGQEVIVPASIDVHISLGMPETPPPSQASAQVESEYILPFSSTRALTDEDLWGLSKTDLRLARNEIYARHGRQFNDSVLQVYFDSKSWYADISKLPLGTEPELSALERANITKIQDYESRQ